MTAVATLIRTRPLAAAGFAASGLWLIIALATWGQLVNGSRVGSPWETYESGQAYLFADPIQLAPILGVVALNIAAAMLGFGLVIRPIWGARRLVSPIWAVLAGVIPGTLLIIPVSRIVTLAAPNSVAPGLLATLIFVATFAVAWKTAKPRSTPLARGIRYRGIWSALAALALVLIAYVHLDLAHVIGEGSYWFIANVYLSDAHGLSAGGYWPLVSQHYDEAMFLYPVIYGLVAPDAEPTATITAVYWIMLAVGRVSLASLAFLALRGLGVDRLSAVVLVAFVAGSSLSLNPLSSQLLFDSLSPLGYVTHLSRILVPLGPLLLVSAALSAPGKAPPLALLVAALIGAGLSSMTIHGVSILAWASALALATALAPAAGGTRRFHRAACLACLVTLAGFSLSYGLSEQSAPLRVALLLAGMIGGGAIMAWTLLLSLRAPRDAQGAPPLSAALLLAAMLGGYVLGALFLGNIGIDRTYPILANVWPWSDNVIVERFHSTLGRPVLELRESMFCDTGYDWGFRTIGNHCGSLPLFVRTYGLSLAVMMFVLAWRLARPTPRLPTPDGAQTVLVWAIVACALAQPLGFVAFDFLPAPGIEEPWWRLLSIWLRSRLIEPWFYGGLLIALALFFREAGDRERRIAQSLLLVATAIYALNPLTWPAQIVTNVAYLIATWTGS